MSTEPLTKASQTAGLLIADLIDVYQFGRAEDPMLKILAVDLLDQAYRLRNRIWRIAEAKGAKE